MIGGCTQTSSSSADDAVAAPRPYWNVPAQVVYRIDDRRFLSLENYDQCYGDVYYNDTQKSIHNKLLQSDPTYFRGHIINADSSGVNVAIPTVEPGLVVTGVAPRRWPTQPIAAGPFIGWNT
ncbi:hypothetical protein GCM10010872_21840 [Dyella flava]|nr:hypothetical protein GCM10010872_21840 [Dyella flava]